MDKARRFVAEVIFRVQRNPVLIAAFLAAAQAFADGATLRAAASILLGFAVRQFTAPANEVELREEAAFEVGVSVGALQTPDAK